MSGPVPSPPSGIDYVCNCCGHRVTDAVHSCPNPRYWKRVDPNTQSVPGRMTFTTLHTRGDA